MKQRIDVVLVERGFYASREQAQRAIMAGEITVNGKRFEKPGQLLDDSAEIVVNRSEQQYVSRGAHKLVKALSVFPVTVTGKICLDAGASTGGFTDVMLQSGAECVYAVDVGYGQLAWKLRQDSRVKVFERTNFRYFDAANLPEKPLFIAADLSFISLRLMFPKFEELLADGGDLITLIKPQFEAGRERVGKKGVVRDRLVHEDVLRTVADFANTSGWCLCGLDFSPILGPEGNIEFIAHWRRDTVPGFRDFEAIVANAWSTLVKKELSQ